MTFFGRSMVAVAILVLAHGSARGDVRLSTVKHPSLAGRLPGLDFLIGTSDDIHVAGANPNGGTSFIAWLDPALNWQVIGAGTTELDLGYATTAIEFAPTSDVALTARDLAVGFHAGHRTDRPREFEFQSDHTVRFSWTLAADPMIAGGGPAKPFVEIEVEGRGVWWQAGEFLDAIAALRHDPLLGDLRGYAAYLESIAPAEAATFVIGIAARPVEEGEFEGSFAEHWRGGSFVYVLPEYTTARPMPEPALGLSFGAGSALLLAMRSRRRTSA